MPCPTCLKPEPLCICTAVEPVDNRVFVLILQHPQEKAEVLGTARLTQLQLRNSLLKVGLSWPNLKRILGREIDYKKWGVLYLGTAKSMPEGLSQPVVAVNTKSGEPLSDQAGALQDLEGIILLDGNWSQAKALWWRNAWMLKCRRIVLNPDFRSRYGRMRKEPRRESVSTLEAAALCVSHLQGDDALFDRIVKPFGVLLDKIRDGRRRSARTANTAQPGSAGIAAPAAGEDDDQA